MKSLALIATGVLVTLCACCLESSAQNHSVSGLKQYTPDQLTACYDNAKICGTTDTSAISAELARRLPELSTERLAACFDNQHMCGVTESPTTGTPISDELARRGNPSALFTLYWKTDKPDIRAGVEHVAYHFDSPQAEAFMRQAFAKHLNDGEDLYYPANYLAKRCDPAALKMLSSGRYRDQGCLQYQSTIELFGRCKYRPAIPYLVDTALQDSCSNIGKAAADDLAKLYPKAPHDFENLDDLQAFYCAQARKDGLGVTCTATVPK